MLRKRSLMLWLLLVGLVSMLLLGAVPVRADDRNDGNDHSDGKNRGAVRLLKTIPTPGSPLVRFDISWVDPDTQLYYLADRSNEAVVVVDAKKGTFVKQIHATPTSRRLPP